LHQPIHLISDYKKGNRPSYIKAAKPDKAIPLFEYFKDEIKIRTENRKRHFWCRHESFID
jgi:D-Tyr-tRNAtyr deacylase